MSAQKKQMTHDRRKRARLKQQCEKIASWPDVFEADSSFHAVECPAGDRVVSAHVISFEEATRKMVEDVWGSDTSTTKVIRYWDHFILGQLLDLVNSKQGTNSLSNPASSLGSTDVLCGVCLLEKAHRFTQSVRVSSISADAQDYDKISQYCESHCVSEFRNSQRPEVLEKNLSKPLRMWTLDTIDL